MSELNTHFKPQRYAPLFKYDENVPSQAFAILSKGFSKVATAGKLGVTPKTFWTWCQTYPEFAEAVELGFAAGQASWEELAQTPEHEQFDAKVYTYNMANIYRVNPQSNVNVQVIVPEDGGVDKAKEIMTQLADTGAI